ncbi:MAG TPA: hypothetical protein VK550_16635 [Polyangiaceae bacterium]|nr:hypothetical protein [Polyangiaceae bacterium]
MKARPTSFVGFLSRLGVKLEPGQLAFWAVAVDGVDPCDLSGEARELARGEIFSCERISPEARAAAVVATVKGAGVGFSYAGGLYMLYAALTGDHDGAPGEVRPALVCAPDMRLMRQVVRFALGAAQSERSIRSRLENVTADGFTLRREDGRLSGVEGKPATAGGRATRGARWVAALLDEAAFFKDADSGIVNDADIFGSVGPRNRGITLIGSTPWSESGLLWSFYTQNYGKPTNAIAAKLRTEVARTDPKVLAYVQRERERDPENCAREHDCEFLPRGSAAFFDPEAVDACIVGAA